MESADANETFAFEGEQKKIVTKAKEMSLFFNSAPNYLSRYNYSGTPLLSTNTPIRSASSLLRFAVSART